MIVNFYVFCKQYNYFSQPVLFCFYCSWIGRKKRECDFFNFQNVMIYWNPQWHPTPVLLPGKSHGWRSLVGCSPWGRWGSDMTERLHFHALEKEIATHSSVLAWRIPGTEEPGGLPSLGLHRVRHDWSDLAAVAAAALTVKGPGQSPVWELRWHKRAVQPN